ncbi:hypothetical protein [Streptomyces tsukubensis]|uniref:Tetratricopeptide repeat protein n=1 Tax=Streptomyces tsukubensis TaxID=83656 RepID=A0A1V4A7E3_9ACTN|nr:hypothetical protein [Streptomyces tsukubensis]OON77367.1 hypothetical protein B1H18_19225 [Streptomyces tsukubensis]QFR92447.1 hypothetical protein GBW32_04450 [Streptomyces tsukubensis]
MTGQQEDEVSGRDPMMTRIGQVIILQHAGDREEARNRFAALWAEIGDGGDPLHRCTLAHYMADTQDDPADELAWDLAALAAADSLPDDRLSARRRTLALRALAPSLHLNLAADYVKLGARDSALGHLHRARAATGFLTDDVYGAGVRAALDRMETRLHHMEVAEGPPSTTEGRPPPDEAGPRGTQERPTPPPRREP